MSLGRSRDMARRARSGRPLVENLDTSKPTPRVLRAFGTTAVVAITDPSQGDRAVELLAGEVAAIDQACSRFRPDSDVVRLAGAGGRPAPVSRLCWDAVEVALQVAERTGGAVDPTVGAAVSAWGYDRDFTQVRGRFDHPSALEPAAPDPAMLLDRIGWWQVDLDARNLTIRVPPGMVLDLGATAKALAADRAAAQIANATGVGAIVNLGGDVAIAGPVPDGGWAVGIAALSSAPLDAVQQVVAVSSGGLATSSPFARCWTHRGALVHHVIDPTTGEPAPLSWRLVSATGSSCVDANAATTAALVWGADAPDRLRGLGQAGRLVDMDGCVTTVSGWPPDGPGSGADTGRDPGAPAGRDPGAPAGRDPGAPPVAALVPTG